MKIGYKKISKREFYDRGGFSNPKLFRKDNGKGWVYFMIPK